jgi:hypothetical protein
MTMTIPLRFITLHFSQIGLTDGLTFMMIQSSFMLWLPKLLPLFETVGYASAFKVIRSQFHRDPITGQDSDKMHTNLSRNMSQHYVPIF